GHEPPVPGDVDEGQAAAVVKPSPGESEVDGQPAAPFFLPPVRFHAGELPDQSGLPVVDVPSGGYDMHSRASSTARRSTSSESAGSAARSRTHRPCSTRGKTGGRPVRSGRA